MSIVALRKESVDRNREIVKKTHGDSKSLSARRAWIEMATRGSTATRRSVALRKESVDRNLSLLFTFLENLVSLSARRAWIEI